MATVLRTFRSKKKNTNKLSLRYCVSYYLFYLSATQVSNLSPGNLQPTVKTAKLGSCEKDYKVQKNTDHLRGGGVGGRGGI